MHDNAPLKDVVLCSTSLTQDVRTVLTNVASDMGAIHRLDLTTDVTHLIVGNIDTPKYKHVAKERPDIRVLRPQWIEAIREAWTDGGDVDVDGLVEQYRLPTFSDLQICVTGFEDLNQRQTLQTTINDNGATYHGDLTRVVTHLVAARPQGPKYDRAKAWGLKTVSLKWFQESIERGMVLEESLYEPRIPLDEQGNGAFTRDYQRQISPRKRQRADGDTSTTEDAGKRKMRRTASTRLSSHSQSLWADMSGFEDQTTAQNDNQWGDTSETLQLDELDNAPHAPLQGRNAASILGAHEPRPISRTASLPQEEQGLFSNMLCLVRGHDMKITRKILQVLTENGCKIADSPNDVWNASNDHNDAQPVLILPSIWTLETKRSWPDLPTETWLVTEWWIERCIEQKTILDPSEDMLSRAHINISKHCLQGMYISTTGMGNRTLHLSKLVETAGAAYMEKFSPKCSILLVPGLANVNRTKLDYAVKHSIPVVSEDWLYRSIAMGRKVPVAEHLLSPADDANQSYRKDQTLDLSDSMLRDSIKRKDDHSAQRLSAVRKRSTTPSLPMARPRPVKTGSSLKYETTSKALTMLDIKNKAPAPFIEDDASTDDEGGVLQHAQTDGSHSQPLQELPPESNSPPKRSQDMALRKARTKSASTAESPVEETFAALETPAGPTDENAVNVQEIEADKARLDDEIKLLFARQKAAPAVVENENPRRRRKDRKLGRALSNMSNASAPGLRHNPSTEIADSIDTASPIDIPVAEELPPMPSQQLGYETIDAHEHRAKMSKRMGTKLTDDAFGVRVESIGVVRDTSSGQGVGGRVRGRHRHTKD